jgi:hypothetical protein
MSVSKYKILIPLDDKQINIPIEMKWDFTERDQAIDRYQSEVINNLVGPVNDFELIRFSHNDYLSANTTDFVTKIFYDFNFFDTGSTISNPTAWVNSYLYDGFAPLDVYSYSKPFTKSFFKLDFYDSTDEATQQNYFTIILPVQQGDFEAVTISAYLTNVKIRKPKMSLDFIGDKEGFFIYWLRKRFYIDLDQFYMSAKFFNGRNGTFTRMMNTKQASLPPGTYYTFNPNIYFYYKVKLNYTAKTYEIFSPLTNNRIGDEINPISWYEYVNP